MSQVTVEYEDEETVVIRIADRQFFGLAFDTLNEEMEDRDLRMGVASVTELCVRPEIARDLFFRLAEELLCPKD